MILTNLIVIASGVLCVIAKFVSSYESLIVGRLLAGIESGLFMGICSIYVTELAPQNLRGFAGTLCPVSITIGILLASLLGLPQILGDDNRWPYLLLLMFVPMLIHIGMFFAVESPKYLYINKKKKQEAQQGTQLV